MKTTKEKTKVFSPNKFFSWLCCLPIIPSNTEYITELVNQVYYQLYQISMLHPNFLLGFVIDSHGDVIAMMDKHHIQKKSNQIIEPTSLVSLPNSPTKSKPKFQHKSIISKVNISNPIILASHKSSISILTPLEIQRFLSTIPIIKMSINNQLSTSITVASVPMNSSTTMNYMQKSYGLINNPSRIIHENESMDDTNIGEYTDINTKNFPTLPIKYSIPQQPHNNNDNTNTIGIFSPTNSTVSYNMMKPSSLVPLSTNVYSSSSSSSYNVVSSVMHIKGNQTLTSIYEHPSGTILIIVCNIHNDNQRNISNISKGNELYLLSQINLSVIENTILSQLPTIHNYVHEIQHYIYSVS